jgi:4-diphosphocytidyl-2-C-methyl-D-erythritol kinase
MITFPNAKINLGLHVLNKRPDGYHEMESCIYPVGLCDVLEIIESNTFQFQSSGLAISGKEENNLVIKAYRLLADEYKLPTVQIHLHKVIPMGAGLGGGSSDAAYALNMLNELFQLHITTEKLEAYASQLGSDCPFFIQNKPVIVSGTGTTIRPASVDLSSYRIELVHPDVHVSTAEAYSMITPKLPKISIDSALSHPVSDWNNVLVNDFEVPMLQRFPEIAKAKKAMYDKGAIYAAMTGSGSSVFGMFER